MGYCSKCGAKLNGGNFCGECGSPIEENKKNVNFGDLLENNLEKEKANDLGGESSIKDANNSYDEYIEPIKDESQPNIFNKPATQDTIETLPYNPSVKSKKKKGIGCFVCIAVLVVFGIIGIITNDGEGVESGVTGSIETINQQDAEKTTKQIAEKATKKPKEKSTEKTTDKPTEKVSDDLQLLISAGLNKEEAQTILNDLAHVGVKGLSSLKPTNGTGVDELQSFNFTSSVASGTLTIEKRKTYFISASKIILFDLAKGGYIDNLDRYGLDSAETIQFKIYAEDYVKQGLKSPSTADFPSSITTNAWSISRKDNVVSVQAYVDSQNSFGAMIRSNFVVQIDYKTGACTYLNIDGKVLSGKLVK